MADTPTWATSDDTKATVTPAADGKTAVVDFVGAGAVDISATVGKVTKKASFTVTPPPTLSALTVKAASRVGGQTVTVTESIGTGLQRRYKITDASAKPTVNYDTACPTANGWTEFPANGQIIGTKYQVVTVVDVTRNGDNARAKGEATLPDPTPATVAVTGVTLNKTTASVEKGKTVVLTPTVAPSNATNKSVTWSSDKTAVATVSNGTVTGVAAGSATITVTTADGKKTATCAVTVTEPASA